MAAEALEIGDPTTSESLVSELQGYFDSFAEAVEAGDVRRSDAVLVELVEFLGSISDAAISNPDSEDSVNNATAVLDHVLGYISNPSLDQAVIDELPSPLLEATAKFAGISTRCLSISESITGQLIAKCPPRDMLAFLCGALALYGKQVKAPDFIAPTLRGIAKVFASIKRRHLEIARATVPAILNTLNAVYAGTVDSVAGSQDLFEGAIDVATSIKAASEKLEGSAKQQLRAFLGLYVLQVLALVSIDMGHKVSDCLPIVITLSYFFPYCGLLYADLVTGHVVDALTKCISDDETSDVEHYMKSFCYVKHGAVLSVTWGYISDDVADAAGQDFTTLKSGLRNTQERRWQAVGMHGHLFSMGSLPWNLKRDAIDFLLAITDTVYEQRITEDTTSSFYSARLVSALQAIATVIMYASDAALRKNAFSVLKRVLADSPTSLRLDILQHLVRNSTSPSMIAILLDCARENLQTEKRKPVSSEVLKENGVNSSMSFWNAGVLELVEFVLRPPNGGPPSLPEQSDAVLSALNLYRFVLIVESTGKTNDTGVCSRYYLEKAYNEWLLPLRTMVTGIVAENRNDYDPFAVAAICSLNPLEVVLYRCIELVEEELKR
ncbi:hypothetical protein Dimus_019396 [Dionaea muscipula]